MGNDGGNVYLQCGEGEAGVEKVKKKGKVASETGIVGKLCSAQYFRKAFQLLSYREMVEGLRA